MSKEKKVTMQEIADLLGVSKVTVSKAINGKEGVGESTRRRIMETARDMGYQLPSKNGVEPMKGTKIAVFCNDRYFDKMEKGNFYIRIYKSISENLSKHGCIATLLTVKQEPPYENFEAFLINCGFDGIILLGKLKRDFLESIRDIPLPRLFVDSDQGSLPGDSIIIENFYSMYSAVRYLLDNGHREIAFVGAVHATQSITDRYLGYCRAMFEYHLPILEDWIIPDRTQDNEQLPLVLPERMPTAFVCNCDAAAYSLEQLLLKNGIRIPEDVSIISFDDDSFAELCSVPLTTVAVNMTEMANKAVRQILEWIEHPQEQSNQRQRVTTHIVYRDSVKRLE